jgi:hypothetical protein
MSNEQEHDTSTDIKDEADAEVPKDECEASVSDENSNNETSS